MEFLAPMIELAKYTTPAVVVAVVLGYLMWRGHRADGELMATSHEKDAERANDRSVALEDLLGNHMHHVEEALDRQTEGQVVQTTVMQATCRVLERALDKL